MSEKKNLVKQTCLGRENYVHYFKTILSAFKDKRYIQVDEKPIFLIHNSFAIPNVSRFMKLWRDLSMENGLSEIHFIGLASGKINNISKVLELGFDAIAPSNLWIAESKIKGERKKYFKQNKK